MLSNKDLQQIQSKNIDIETVEAQLERFKEGFPFTRLEKAATLDDGILQANKNRTDELIQYYEEQQKSLRILKFVPASGAASRMFKDLYAFLELAVNNSKETAHNELKENPEFKSVNHFFKNIENFAFYEDLQKEFNKQNMYLQEAILKHEYGKILNTLLNPEGLNYGNLPKALLKFHKYANNTRTPVEEHLVEGAMYGKSAGNEVYIHFTVSPDIQQQFMEHVKEIMPQYEDMFGVTYEISYSIQKPSTDTIAATPDNEPFRNADDTILFRPGGHGALLENVNEFDHDLVFIKNIDNVVPDRLKPETYRNKKLLAGILLEVQNTLFAYQEKFTLSAQPDDETIEKAFHFITNKLNVNAGKEFFNKQEKISYIQQKLYRPLRVCGMVKNEGEPGGGPYWARNSDGSVSLQIVESSQVDMKNEEQQSIFNNATHFNPVDIVCSVKNFRGDKYDLKEFVDPETGFISKKSKDGKELKALELPGLWNGSMSNWNTIFVEVPIMTFNPVKKVNDLLRESHQ
ncbi:MAG: DUF4301 family protein [Cyclobacteriaceae bacterium]